jgi:hypothetical protein
MKRFKVLTAAVAFFFAIGFVTADACDVNKAKGGCGHKTGTEKVSNEGCESKKEASQKAEVKTEAKKEVSKNESK